MFTPILDDTIGTKPPLIKVIGVGGGGGNALNHMVNTITSQNLEGVTYFGNVEYYSVNTDAQVLRSSAVAQTSQIGANLTKGLGAGGKPQIGYQAAEEDREALSMMLEGADMVFIAAGMGGGTGTGAAPVIAEIAKSKGILTIAIVTKPFGLEGKVRVGYAEQGIDALSKHVDSLIIIQNEKLVKVLPRGVSLKDAFAYANNVLRNSVIGISDMIIQKGVINVDFADVQTIMSDRGRAMMGFAEAEGEDRAEKAIQEAIASPLLEDVDLTGAKAVLVNILTDGDFKLDEFYTIMEYVKASTHSEDEATIIIGTAEDPELNGKLRVTIVVTGLGQQTDALSPHKMSPIGTTYGVGQTTQRVPPVSNGGFIPNGNGMPPQVVGNNGGYGQGQYATSTPIQPPEVNEPQQVDKSGMWSPNSFPGFMQQRNNNNNGQ